MVNITARQWVLKPLLHMKYGQGAYILPPAPAPQLTSIKIRYPKQRNAKPTSRTAGIHDFLRDCLPRLKYYNPQIDIEVDNPHNMKAAGIVTLHFEGTDRDGLEALVQKAEKTKDSRPVTESSDASKSGEAWEEFKVPSEPSESEEVAQTAKAEENPKEAQPAKEPKPKKSKLRKPNIVDDSVVLKPQPAANPNAPSTTSPPNPVYMRTVALATNNRPHWEIWKWLKYRVPNGRIPQITAEDKEFWDRRAKKEAVAAETRIMIREVAAKTKEEQAALAKAKRAADEAAAGNI